MKIRRVRRKGYYFRDNSTLIFSVKLSLIRPTDIETPARKLAIESL